MKNKYSLFFLCYILLLTSCFKQAAEVPYSHKITAYNNPKGIVTENDVQEGLKLKKSIPEGTGYVADFTVSVFKFGYFADNVKNGNPIYANEDCFEKYIATNDFVKFKKVEFFNDQIGLNAFNVKLGTNENVKMKKSDYFVTNFQSGGTFYSDVKQAHYITDLGVVGTNLRINYTKVYKDAKYLTSVYFLDEFPQQERVISLEVPSYLNIEIVEKNFEGYSIEKNNQKYFVEDEQFKQYVSKEKAADKTRFITYAIKNTQAIKSENNQPGYSYNVPHLVILVKSFDENLAKSYSKAPPKEDKIILDERAKSEKAAKTLRDLKNAKLTQEANEQKAKATKDKKVAPTKNQPIKTNKLADKKDTKKPEVKPPVALIGNLNDLYTHYAQIVSKVDNDSTVFLEKLKSIVANKKTDMDIIEAVFYWVQDNIRYVAFEDGLAAFKPENCQNVYAQRYGDCKGMANLLKCMLTSLGYDARLTWIGTKHLNYSYSIPSILVDNHMICTVLLNGKKYYLDATESFIGIDDYADRIQGRQAMVQDGAKYFIDTIPNFSADRNLYLRKAVFSLNDNIYEGSVNEVIKGENKTNILRAYANTRLDKRNTVIQDFLDPDDVDIDVSNISSSDLSVRKGNVLLSYDLVVNNHLITVDDMMMLKPDYKREFYNAKADSGRYFDLQFNHKLNYVNEYKFEVPEGYNVMYFPENLIINNKEFAIELTYELRGNYIVYKKSISLKNGRITKANFKQWNNAIDRLRNNYNQYIKLKRK